MGRLGDSPGARGKDAEVGRAQSLVEDYGVGVWGGARSLLGFYGDISQEELGFLGLVRLILFLCLKFVPGCYFSVEFL